MSTKVKKLKKKIETGNSITWEEVELKQYAHSEVKFNVPTTGWSNNKGTTDNPYYDIDINISDPSYLGLITSTCNGIFSLDRITDEAKYKAAVQCQLRLIGQASNQVTIRARKIPTEAIPCVIVGIYEP